MGGFYTWVTHKTGHLPLSPPKLLAALVAIVAALSAVFSNDLTLFLLSSLVAAADGLAEGLQLLLDQGFRFVKLNGSEVRPLQKRI